jgi:adenylylsulfate kinase-like enzyme
MERSRDARGAISAKSPGLARGEANSAPFTKHWVLWITGLSGAGKSTLALKVAQRLRAKGEAVVVLDGDVLREVFGATATNAQNHGREGRLALAFQYAHLCRVVASQGLTVVIATISLFKEIHA